MAKRKRRASKKPEKAALEHVQGLGFVPQEELQHVAGDEKFVKEHQTPFQKEMSALVDKELAGATDLALSMGADRAGEDFMLRLLREAKIASDDEAGVELFKESLKALHPGAVLCVGRAAVIRTPDGQIEDVASYIFRVEKSLIALSQQLSKLKSGRAIYLNPLDIPTPGSFKITGAHVSADPEESYVKFLEVPK